MKRAAVESLFNVNLKRKKISNKKISNKKKESSKTLSKTLSKPTVVIVNDQDNQNDHPVDYEQLDYIKLENTRVNTRVNNERLNKSICRASLYKNYIQQDEDYFNEILLEKLVISRPHDVLYWLVDQVVCVGTRTGNPMVYFKVLFQHSHLNVKKWECTSLQYISGILSKYTIEKKNLFKLWKQKRKMFIAPTFIPTMLTSENYFNTYSGLAISRDMANHLSSYSNGQFVEQFKLHIYKTICYGDTLVYEKILSILAKKLQYPEWSYHQLILSKGAQSIGKSTIWILYKLLFGIYGHEKIFSYEKNQFNEESCKSLVFVLEEFLFPKNLDEEAELKAMLTANEIIIDEKYLPRYNIQNHRLYLGIFQTFLYCIVLYCIVLYYIVLFCFVLFKVTKPKR